MSVKNKKIRKFVALFLLAITPLFLAGCFKKGPEKKYKLELEVWGVFDDSIYFQEINKTFAELYPQISRVNYKKVSSNPVDYEKELIDAIGNGNGPDVFFFKNTWMAKHDGKISPFPKGKDEKSYQEKYLNLQGQFVDVAIADFFKNGSIYALPLYCDTLALFYNQEIFNQAGIINPPKTWDELKGLVPILTKIDEYGNIKQSAIALGRSKEPGAINRSSDIITLLMMQAGAQMNDPQTKRASFNYSSGSAGSPAKNAINFYTQFSQINNPLYTWNARMDYSIDAFRFGKLAMMLNYSYLAERLKATDPKLNFKIAEMPQLDLEKKVNFASYWGLAATKIKSLPQGASYTNDDRIEEAWRYIQFATSKPPAGLAFDPNKNYLEKTRKPAARKDLIETQKTDPLLTTFAQQSLTAKSWYQPDELAIEDIFTEMIHNVVTGQSTTTQAISIAISKYDALIR